MVEKRVIELSKVKIVLLLAASIAFVFLGAWLLSQSTETIESQRRFNTPTLFYGIGVVSIVFFGLCGLVGIKKLIDKSPGLIVSTEGILDNSSGVSVGLIPWSEIVGIGEYQFQMQKSVSIYVADPNKYANNGNILKKITLRASIRMCGTPVNISANSLKISYCELFETINEYHQNSLNNA